ncbi:MAG: transposase [Geminicoccaceae bacterium]
MFRGGPSHKFCSLIREIAAARSDAGRIEIWFQDEARIGQTGRNGRRWIPARRPPVGIRDRRHEAVYLFGAACPERDTAIGLVLPVVSTAAMQAFLDELATHVEDGAHAVVIMDRAARDGLLAIAPPVMDRPPAGADGTAPKISPSPTTSPRSSCRPVHPS